MLLFCCVSWLYCCTKTEHCRPPDKKRKRSTARMYSATNRHFSTCHTRGWGRVIWQVFKGAIDLPGLGDFQSLGLWNISPGHLVLLIWRRESFLFLALLWFSYQAGFWSSVSRRKQTALPLISDVLFFFLENLFSSVLYVYCCYCRYCDVVFSSYM